MTITTPNWNIDKFGEKQGSTLYNHEKRENNQAYTPIEGETLAGYTRRLATLIQNLENINLNAHTGRSGTKMWFTHRTPSSCWLCDQLNVMWFIYETLNLVSLSMGGETLVFKSKDAKLVLSTPSKA